MLSVFDIEGHINAGTIEEYHWAWRNAAYSLPALWLTLFVYLWHLSLRGQKFQWTVDVMKMIEYGAPVRGVEGNLITLLKCWLATWYHLHGFHVLSNCAGVFLSHQAVLHVVTHRNGFCYRWVLFWFVPIWAFTAVIGGIFTFLITLGVGVTTCGASGGVLGLSTFSLIFNRLSYYAGKQKMDSRTVAAMTAHLGYEMIPYNIWKGVTNKGESALLLNPEYSGAMTDWGCHCFGAIAGGITACVLCRIHADLSAAELDEGAILIRYGMYATACSLLWFIVLLCSIILFGNMGPTARETFYRKRLLGIKDRTVAEIHEAYGDNDVQFISTEARFYGTGAEAERVDAENYILDKLKWDPPHRMESTMSAI